MMKDIILNIPLNSKVKNKEGIHKIKNTYNSTDNYYDCVYNNYVVLLDEIIYLKDTYKNTKEYKGIEENIRKSGSYVKVINSIYDDAIKGKLKYDNGLLKPQSFIASFKRAIKNHGLENMNLTIPEASYGYSSKQMLSTRTPSYAHFNWLKITDKEVYSKAIKAIESNAVISVLDLMHIAQNRYFEENDDSFKKYKEISEFQSLSNIVLDNDIFNNKEISDERLKLVYDNMLNIRKTYMELVEKASLICDNAN